MNRRYDKIIKIVGCDQDELQEASTIISQLNPNPRSMVDETDYKINTIIPDLMIEKINDKWNVIINDGNCPNLLVSKNYLNMYSDKKQTKDVKIFLKSKIQSARWFIEAIESRNQTMQKIMQSGLRPFLLRFYDEDESIHATRNETFSGCVMFLGFEGMHLVANSEYNSAITFCKDAGGLLLGPKMVQDWMHRRFDYSTIEKIINTPGGLAETIEVAHFWTEIHSTYNELKKTFSVYIDEVLGHFSHAYPQGTSLYIILLNKKDSNKEPTETEEKLKDIWKSVHDITSKTGAMTAHHHGVGIARLPIIGKELGTGMFILNQIKNSLDPSNILCPGKLGL